MKKFIIRPAIICILLFLLGTYESACAQVSAVMQAKVNIVSGATYSYVEETHIDSYNIDASLGKIQTGLFTLKNTPGTDVKVYIHEKSAEVNNQGDELEFDFISEEQNSFSTGRHYINLVRKVKNSHTLSDQYRSSVTAVIVYL